MSIVTYRCKSMLLMRVGPTESIRKCYNEKKLQFGCAANWLDYALKYGNETTGDIFECIFAHIPKGDPRSENIVDEKGKPMGDNLLILENSKDGSKLLRFMPTILMPVLCLYSFDFEKMVTGFSENQTIPPYVLFNLDQYREDMQYHQDESSFLLIEDVNMFFNDLRTAIPIAVDENRDNLTSERFYHSFDSEKPFICRDVNYNKYTEIEPFFDYQSNREELFWKLPQYRNQAELRIAISHLNFKQIFDPQKRNYDYKLNTLEVFLPHLHEYANIYSASEAHTLYFDNFDLQNRSCTFSVLRSSIAELQKLRDN